MADEVNKFLLLFVLSSLAVSIFSAPILPTCSLTVGGKKFTITSRTWEYRVAGYIYSINLCQPLKLTAPCVKSKFCKHSGSSYHDLGGNDPARSNSSLALDGSGFALRYYDGTCEKNSNGDLVTLIQMKCGKTMGSPKFIDEYTNSKSCVVVFEFVTNEACKRKPAAAEVPCSLYNDTSNKEIDLSPLIKINGGYEVASENFTDNFFINICRDITPEKNGRTSGCPAGGSSCRKAASGSTGVTIGKVTVASIPKLMPTTGHVVITYNTTSSVAGCTGNPSTKITLACPKDLHQTSGKGPVMLSSENCMYDVFWETEYACPQEQLMSNNSCILSNEFVQFDLTPLQRPSGHNYKVNGTDIKGSKTYFYYINVCRSTNIPDCTPSGYNASICQEVPDTNEVVSLGVFYEETLSYTDGQLTLKYKGGKTCSDGFGRETIINFICDPLINQGNPKFGGELSHCVYFFDWRTRYACPPSRRTGSSCRVTNNAGVRYDLSELVRTDQPNWLAIDGETSSSDRKIYINVCGKLTKQVVTSKCDDAAAVCLVSKDGSVKSLGRYSSPPTLNMADMSVQLVYTNGDECIKGVRRRTNITFVCHPGDLTSPPVLVSHSPDDCEYTIMWKTAAACSLGINVGKHCKVEDKDAGYVFDLSLIPTSRYYTGIYAELINNKNTYYLKVCNATNNDTKSNPCKSIVGACQKSSTGSGPISLGKPSTELYYYDGIIKLKYSNGDQCSTYHKPRETHISFICDPRATHNGDGLPEFERQDHCDYHFRWPTKYACPAKVIECAVRSGSNQYDLSSLVKTDDNWPADGPGSGTFYINVCRSLNLNTNVLGCLGTSSVCLKDRSGNFIDLGGVDKSLNVTAQGTITITYTKGKRCDTDPKRTFETQIMFICKKGAIDKGPKFKEKTQCTYKFIWETASACVISNVVGSDCSVKDPKSATTFNLFPLSRPVNQPYQLTMPNGRHFLLNICGKIPKGTCGKKADVGVCMKETDGTMLNLGVATKKLAFMGETLVLTYSNGDRDVNNGFPRISKIRFYCNPKVALGQPKYVEQASEKDGEVFYFEFQTSLACSAKQVECALRGTDNKKYDLTPLGLVTSNWEAVDSRPAYKHLHYYINVCRSINPSASNGIKCPGGAIGACQIDHSNKKGHNLGYIQSNPKITSEGQVTLWYYGGDACHQKFNRSTRINFSCSKTMGSPVFITETPTCEYVFHWETPSACPLTSEYGSNCKVLDRQYNYQFDFSSLSGKDYNVTGIPGGGTVKFRVCDTVHGTSCKGSNVAACLVGVPGAKEGKILGTVSSNITYLDGELFILYKASTGCFLKVTFECDQTAANKMPMYESFEKPCNYSLRWPTNLACRPFTHVHCSLRQKASDGKTDLQYDFTPLAKNNGNWKAINIGSSSTSSYWINVCRSVNLNGEAASCPPTAGVCKIDTVSGKKRYTSLGSLSGGPVVENNNIYLWYRGGDPCQKDKATRSSAKILMKCGSSTEGAPELLNEYPKTCLYEFVWDTKYACPVNTVNETITNDCKAVNPKTNYKFNLNALADADKEVKGLSGDYFLIHVCKVLNDQKAIPCGKNSGSCQLSKGSSSFHFNAGNYNSRLIYRDGVLFLTYDGGDICHHSNTKRQSMISFVCDPKTTEDYGKPVFVAESNDCTYFFTWHTKLACERKVECSPIQYGDNANTKYGLQNLANDKENWLVIPSFGSDKDSTFYINICRPLVPISGVNCPAGASACMKTKNDVQSLGRAVKPPTVKNGKIIIEYVNGTKQAETRIELTCNPGSLGKPILASHDKNTYVFTWATLAACPKQEIVQIDKCRVYDNNTEYFYDVSPLKKASYNGISLTASDGTKVFASVCGSLQTTGCDGDGVCKKIKDKTTSLGKFKNINMAYLNSEKMLLLKYCSKSCNDAANTVTSRIIFICDESATAYKQYSLESVGDTGANIIWKTNLVCPPARQQCVFSDNGLFYDLQILSSRTRSWHYTSDKGFKFWLNICRGVEDQTGCPPYATVCAQFGGKDSQILVLGYGKTQQITHSSKKGTLLLRYTGQSNIPICTNKGPAEVSFQLTCARTYIGKPKLVEQSTIDCSFQFHWVTMAACDKSEKTLDMSGCQVKHPDTGRIIDFKQLDKSTTPAVGENSEKYYFSICGTLKNVPSDCVGKSVCKGTTGYDINSKELRYEDETFELWLTSKRNCKTGGKEVFIIDFQCSDKIGKPVYEYESSTCHYVFSWPTSLVCTKDQSGDVDDSASKGRSAGSSSGKKAGIAIAVIFTLLGIALVVFVLHNQRRRTALVVFVRSNVRKIRRKGDNSSIAVYKYQKITVEDEEDHDLLLGFSDDENEEDEEMITL